MMIYRNKDRTALRNDDGTVRMAEYAHSVHGEFDELCEPHGVNADKVIEMKYWVFTHETSAVDDTPDMIVYADHKAIYIINGNDGGGSTKDVYKFTHDEPVEVSKQELINHGFLPVKDYKDDKWDDPDIIEGR